MNEITDDQMLYAYDLLSFYLTSTETLDKSDIANQMANDNAILILPNGADKDGKTPMLAMALGQNLNQAEIANIGSKWYMENDFEHRDAAFEEIFHMVHDYGIGTTKILKLHRKYLKQLQMQKQMPYLQIRTIGAQKVCGD